MALLILSFVAGLLTVAAPCILPLLPVIVGGSIARSGNENASYHQKWLRPLIIAASLAISVVAFTLLLKATSTLLMVPSSVWQIISGTIVLLLGLTLVAPKLWEKLAGGAKLNITTNKLLGRSFLRGGRAGDLLIGFSLGPVFASCSPTYAFIVASVLPASLALGITYLGAYAAGLAGMLLVIAYGGQALTSRLGWLSNPSGAFKRVVGVLFIVVGLAVITGLDKKIQAYVLGRGWYDPIYKLERSLEQN